MTTQADVKALLDDLHQNPIFAALRDDVLIKDVPVVKPWRVTDTGGQEDVWKYESGLREGYLLALSKLRITL